MNSKVLLAAGAIIAIVVIGLLLMNQKKGSLSVPGQKTTGSAITSIKDALGAGTAGKCEYTDAQGKTGTVYAKGGKVRVEGYGQGDETSLSIYTGEKSYVWNPTTKKGFAFTIPQTTPTAQTTPVDSQGDLNKTVEALNNYKQKCTNESVADSMFVPPADVTFQDFSAIMQKNTQNIQEQLQKTGVTIPSY